VRPASLLLVLFTTCLCLAQSGLPGLVKYTPPPGFKRDDKRAPEGRVAYFAPERNNYSPSVMLKSYKAMPNQTAKSLGLDTVTAMVQAHDIKVMAHSETKVAGKPAYSIRLDLKLYGDMKVAQRQMIVIHKGKAVIWTCSALAKTSASTLAAFDKSLKSVVWQ
jgi:hypothetical protein